mmetsp:Transcript_130052/g.324172  ORF Transcript_130052/g.324172 Transcript_130052/m.324172 type:complete len:414 (+) Transcript_130052:364-1605(+)
MHVLLQHGEVRWRDGLGPICQQDVALNIHLDLVPEYDCVDLAGLRRSDVDSVGLRHHILLKIELEDFEHVRHLPDTAIAQGAVCVYHQACAVVIEDAHVEAVDVFQLLAELECCSPNCGTRRDDLVLEGVAHFDPRGAHEDQDALTQQARVDQLRYHELSPLRLARQLTHVLGGQEDVLVEVVVPQSSPREFHHLWHLLNRDNCVPVGLNVFVSDASLPRTLCGDHRNLGEARSKVCDPQRRAVQLGDVFPLFHDLLQGLVNRLSVCINTLLLPKPQQQPPWARDPAVDLRHLRRHHLEAYPRATVRSADVDAVAFGDLNRRCEPLRSVAVVAPLDLWGTRGGQTRRCMVELHVGSQGQSVPESDAIEDPILCGHEVKICLPAHLHLRLCEVKLEYLVHRTQCSPRLGATLLI